MKRGYEDYEELGRYIEIIDETLARAQGKLMYMFPLEDEQSRPLPSEYEGQALNVRFALDELRRAVTLEFEAELPEIEVPPGKPRKPYAFGRGEAQHD